MPHTFRAAPETVDPEGRLTHLCGVQWEQMGQHGRAPFTPLQQGEQTGSPLASEGSCQWDPKGINTFSPLFAKYHCRQ